MLNFFRAWMERRRRFRIALGFNRLLTYSNSEPGAGQWMCPTCIKVHRYTAHSVFSGRQFPACCEFEEGHRLDKYHATGL